MSAVTFDVNEFRSIYPEFSSTTKYTDAQLENLFLIAEQFCDNTDFSLVLDLTERKVLLYLLVAHLAILSKRPGGIVGIQRSASEGSVSTSFTVPTNINWYKQTQYGWMYWTLTMKYRIGGRYYEYIRDN